MKINSVALTLPAAAAVAFAPAGVPTISTLTPAAAHAGPCGGATDGAGNNTAAAHNACCRDQIMAGQPQDPGCASGPLPLPAPAPPPQLGPCPGGHSPMIASPCN
jgi:hypothetical protein